MALAAVIVFHTVGYFAVKTGAPPAHNGWLGAFGVQLFFAISGFVLAMPFGSHFLHATAKPTYREYLIRRVTRIEPPYVINLLLVFALMKFAPTPHFLASLAYSHNLAFGSPNTMSVVLWSLEVEVQFYLLAPALFAAFRLKPAFRRTVWALLGIGATCAQALFAAPRVHFSLLGQAQFFLAGVIAADLYLSGPRNKSALWDWVSFAMAAVIALAVPVSGFQPVLPILLTTVIIAALRGPATGALLGMPVIAAVGGMCYTFYLYHYFVISGIRRVALRLSTPAAYLLCFAAILVFCPAAYLLTERPFMRRGWHTDAARALWRIVGLMCRPERRQIASAANRSSLLRGETNQRGADLSPDS